MLWSKDFDDNLYELSFFFNHESIIFFIGGKALMLAVIVTV